MNKIFTILLCLSMICVSQSCDNDEIGEYTPLPKLHLGETFKYQCIPENYVQLAYDTLGKVAVLNFYKEEITDLDYINYDEHLLNVTVYRFRIDEYEEK
mgnify:CR=1 FL=1